MQKMRKSQTANVVPQTKARIFLLQDSCCLCRVALSKGGDDRVTYTHYDHRTIVVCYKHVFDMSKTPGTLFPHMPTKQLRSFDIVDYLNQARKKIIKLSWSDPAVQKTFGLITQFLDETKLNVYVGGTSTFYRRGLSPIVLKKRAIA